MRRIRIFDIDGTITEPGNDLWYLTTRAFARDKELFDHHVTDWRKQIASGADVYSVSQAMMRKGLDLMPATLSGEQIKGMAREIAQNLLDAGKYFHAAIDYINRSISASYAVIFSTTNYDEGGLGFVEALVESEFVSKDDADKIYISGSAINWRHKTIDHFNLGADKVTGICRLLNIDRVTLSNLVDACFGDDPLGNDREILELTSRAFVIRNDKNKNYVLPKNMRLIDWHELSTIL
jgi:hydroxymethylpyrimidine pyrophosphatase-like HAD family hydrolase